MPKGWHRLASGPKFALSIVAIATVTGVLMPARIRAADAPEAFDDPKLARELPAAPPVIAPVRAPVAGAAAPAKPAPVSPNPDDVPSTPAKPPAAVASAPAKAPSVAAPAPVKAPVAAAAAPVPPVAPAPNPAPVEGLPPAPVVPPPVAAEAPAAVPVAPAEPASVSAPVPAPAAPASVPAPAREAPAASAEAPSSPAPASGTADLTAKARPPEPPAAAAPSGPWPYHPRLKLGYRWFSFSRMPATGSTTPTASETFQSLSLDVYPTSSYLRVGFSSQFGWESGQFQRTGDYFLAESASTGFQLPGRFTPFLEGLAGAGYMRRLQGGSPSSTGYYQLGVDGGVEIYVAKRAYVSIALGYLHPGNLFLQQKNLSGINADTWSLKLGFGI